MRVSAPAWSNRHSVTPSATDEAIAKFVPVTPACSPGVAPSGNGRPGRAAVLPPSGATRAAGTVVPAVAVCGLVTAVSPR